MNELRIALNTGARQISRRTMLKGLGTVAIGLPFLEEMLATTAMAATKEVVPVRAFNVFFGLGIPARSRPKSSRACSNRCNR